MRTTKLETHLLIYEVFYLIVSQPNVKYFEGQLASISEVDDQLDVETLPKLLRIFLDQSAVTGEHTCMLLKP
ncbi:hypothetical protein YC2023_112343 [Brassica napus]